MTNHLSSSKAYNVDKIVPLDSATRERLSSCCFSAASKGTSGSGIHRPYRPDLFDPHFPGAKVEKHILHGRYVSDELTQARLGELIEQHISSAEWSESGFPFMVAAPTGTGKNYFVHHVVHPYAANHGQKVLYLCNRKALAFQQMREADQAVNPAIQENSYPSDAAEYTTGSITLAT